MRNPFKRRKKKIDSDASRETKQPMAVAAEAAAPRSIDGDGVEGRLVVMGRESTFSEEVVEYAIDMAQRMDYEILALNSAPLSCDAFSMFSTSRSKLCQEFRTISEKSAQIFRQSADAHGIPFVHVVKYDEPEQALSSLQQEYDNIEFVIADTQPQAVEQAAEGSRPQNELFVYSMI